MQIEFPMRNDDRMSRKTIPLTLHNLRILSSCQNQELIELLVDRFVHRTMEPLMDSDREREREKRFDDRMLLMSYPDFRTEISRKFKSIEKNSPEK